MQSCLHATACKAADRKHIGFHLNVFLSINELRYFALAQYIGLEKV